MKLIVNAGGRLQALTKEQLLVKAEKELIPGGKAAGKPDSDFPVQKLNEGANVEMEHTTDRKVAREIAKDHLTEDVNYYDKPMFAEEKKGKSMKKGELTPKKARQMLHDKQAQGHPLTEKQRGYFGAVASGVAKKSAGPRPPTGMEGATGAQKVMARTPGLKTFTRQALKPAPAYKSCKAEEPDGAVRERALEADAPQVQKGGDWIGSPASVSVPPPATPPVMKGLDKLSKPDATGGIGKGGDWIGSENPKKVEDMDPVEAVKADMWAASQTAKMSKAFPPRAPKPPMPPGLGQKVAQPKPLNPAQPAQPGQPVAPVQPGQAAQPAQPAKPGQPQQPGQMPQQPGQPAHPPTSGMPQQQLPGGTAGMPNPPKPQGAQIPGMPAITPMGVHGGAKPAGTSTEEAANERFNDTREFVGKYANTPPKDHWNLIDALRQQGHDHLANAHEALMRHKTDGDLEHLHKVTNHLREHYYGDGKDQKPTGDLTGEIEDRKVPQVRGNEQQGEVGLEAEKNPQVPQNAQPHEGVAQPVKGTSPAQPTQGGHEGPGGKQEMAPKQTTKAPPPHGQGEVGDSIKPQQPGQQQKPQEFGQQQPPAKGFGDGKQQPFLPKGEPKAEDEDKGKKKFPFQKSMPGLSALGDFLEKARNVTPIGGTTPGGYKKVAEGQYVKEEPGQGQGGKQLGMFGQESFQAKKPKATHSVQDEKGHYLHVVPESGGTYHVQANSLSTTEHGGGQIIKEGMGKEEAVALANKLAGKSGATAPLTPQKVGGFSRLSVGQLGDKPLSYLRGEQERVKRLQQENYRKVEAIPGGLQNPPKELAAEADALAQYENDLTQVIQGAFGEKPKKQKTPKSKKPEEASHSVAIPAKSGVAEVKPIFHEESGSPSKRAGYELHVNGKLVSKFADSTDALRAQRKFDDVAREGEGKDSQWHRDTMEDLNRQIKQVYDKFGPDYAHKDVRTLNNEAEVMAHAHIASAKEGGRWGAKGGQSSAGGGPAQKTKRALIKVTKNEFDDMGGEQLSQKLGSMFGKLAGESVGGTLTGEHRDIARKEAQSLLVSTLVRFKELPRKERQIVFDSVREAWHDAQKFAKRLQQAHYGRGKVDYSRVLDARGVRDMLDRTRTSMVEANKELAKPNGGIYTKEKPPVDALTPEHKEFMMKTMQSFLPETHRGKLSSGELVDAVKNAYQEVRDSNSNFTDNPEWGKISLRLALYKAGKVAAMHLVHGAEKPEEAKKSLTFEGISELENYLSKDKTEASMLRKAEQPQAMPTGNADFPQTEANGGEGMEDPGTMKQVKKAGEPKADYDETYGDAPEVEEEALSDDDAEAEEQMEPHKKPIEESTEKSLTPARQRELVAKQQAVKLAKLRKSRDVVLHPYQESRMNAGLEDTIERRLDRSKPYAEDPSLVPGLPLISQGVICKSCNCKHTAAVTACPNCGAGTTVSQVMPGVSLNGPMGIMQKSAAPVLRPAKKEQDLSFVGGVIPVKE